MRKCLSLIYPGNQSHVRRRSHRASDRCYCHTGQYLNNKWPGLSSNRNLRTNCGRGPFAVGVGSGTSALQIALLSAGVGPGDEVITVPNSFFASTAAILLCGATPRFVDVDERTQLMSLSLVEHELTQRTKAIHRSISSATLLMWWLSKRCWLAEDGRTSS